MSEPINKEPAAEIGLGQLMVQMRLAEGTDISRPFLSGHIYCSNFMGNADLKLNFIFGLIFSSRFLLRPLLSPRGLSSGEVPETTSVFWGGAHALYWSQPGAHLGQLLGNSWWRQGIAAKLGLNHWWVRVSNTLLKKKSLNIVWHTFLCFSSDVVTKMTATWRSSILLLVTAEFLCRPTSNASL